MSALTNSEMVNNVHFFMRNTYDINRMASDKIKDKMLSFRKAVVPVFDVCSMLA